MPQVLTPQQSIAVAYARLRGLRERDDADEPAALEPLCDGFNCALDDLHTAGFDLSAFKLDDWERVEDRDGMPVPSSVLRARLNAILGYLDLLAGLP